MKNFLKLFIFSALIIFGFFCGCAKISAQSNSDQAAINATVQVTLECNNNNICEINFNETSDSCPNDCGCNNNGTCEPARDEENSNCSKDCPGRGGGRWYNYPYIYNILVSKITLDSAEVSWQTAQPTACRSYFGQTLDYEKAIAVEVAFKTSHTVDLDSLSPATTYHFQIICVDSGNLQDQTSDQQFSTLNVLSNVNNFQASSADRTIILTWDNPSSIRFAGVRILRRNDFYPLNSRDGIVVYEGRGNYFIDQNLKNGARYFYAAFVYDQNKNYSSGSVAFAVPQAIPPAIPPVISPVAPSPIPPTLAPSELIQLGINDFTFYFDNKKIPLENSIIKIGKNKPVIVFFDCSNLPPAWKFTMFSYQTKEEFFSYSFGQSQEEAACATEFVSPNEAGAYPFAITFFDQNNHILKKITGTLVVYETAAEKPNEIIIFINIILLIAFFLLIMILILIKRKRNSKLQ